MATQAQGKGKKGGKKGKKGGGNKKTKKDDGPKDTNPPSIYKDHMNNKPKADTPRSRDGDIAKWQNEAAVLEKNIREVTGSIEVTKRDRQAIKNRRQAAYEDMNAARDILQKKKADKDVVFQRIQVYRKGRNSARGDRQKGKGRNFRTIAELNAAIKELERDMSTKVLSLNEEKAKMREIKDLNKMRPEVQKISRQNEVLQQYTESNKDTYDDDQDAYTVLKKATQAAYEVQQGKYEKFQEAVAEDTTLNESIDAAIETRKGYYSRQKEIRNDISDRKRKYQKSQREAQGWERQCRKLKRDSEYWTNNQRRKADDARREEQRAQYQKAREESAQIEEAEQAAEETQNQQRNKRRAERDDPEASPKKAAEPRPPRTTRQPRKPRVERVQQEFVKRDALESQKFQLKEVIAYVKTLLPKTGALLGEDMTGKVSRHKGSFKPSFDKEMAGQDLFSNNRKSKKSKRKKKKKKKDVFFVQSHTPPTVAQAFSSLKRWLSGEGCSTVISLPIKPSEAEECINKLAEAEKFMVDWKPSDRRKPAAAKPAAAEETEEPEEEATPPVEAPEEPEAEPEKDEPTAEEAAPEDTGATEEATEAQEEEEADAEETPVAETEPEAAQPSEAQPEDGDAEEAAPAVDTKQPDNTVEKNEEDAAAPTKATNENAPEGDDSDEEESEEESTDDGEEVVESMVI